MTTTFKERFTQRERSLLKISIFSRLFTLILASLSDLIFPQSEFGDHILLTNQQRPNYSIISLLFKCIVRWDADYFYSISLNGYLRHREHCFFSFYPLTVNAVSRVFRPFVTDEDSILLGAVLVNFIAFQVATIYLYRLSKIFIKNEELAYKAVILFCFNPGSMHFTAMYCDCLFTMFFLMGLFYLYNSNDYLKQGPIFKSVICLFFASWTRANGTFNLFFIGYRFLHIFVKVSIDNQHKIWPTFKKILAYVPLGIFSVVCIVTPFFAHMYYLYSIYCVQLPTQLTDYQPPSYCEEGFWKGYSYLQTKYFGVVFMVWSSLYNLFMNYRVFPIVIFYAVFMLKLVFNQPGEVFLMGIPSVVDEKAVEVSKPRGNFMKSPMLVPFFWTSLVNWAAMLFNSHVINATRIYCQNPLVFWYAAYVLSGGKPAEDGKAPEFTIKRHWILIYFVGRFITGPIIFGGYSPWF